MRHMVNLTMAFAKKGKGRFYFLIELYYNIKILFQEYYDVLKDFSEGLYFD